MIKKMVWLLIALLCNIQFSVFAENKSSLILNDIDWPPYFINKEETIQRGIAKDIIGRCIKPNDYAAEYIKLPVKRTHKYMKNGEIDISVYSYKKSREEFLIYAKQPIFSSEYTFVVKSDSDIIINHLDDLSPYRIGYISGVSYTPQLLQIFKDKRVKDEVTESYHIDAMLLKLLAKKPRFDVMVESLESFYWRAKQLKVRKQVKILNFKFPPKQYFLTVSKQSNNISDKQVFLDNFDQCLIEIKRSGEYQNIFAEYGITLQKTSTDLNIP